MDSEDKIMAYIAGILDGDGSFSIIRENRPSGYKFYSCIQLSNVFEGMIDLLYEYFGGSKKIKSPQSHAKKIQYVWCVRGSESCRKVIEKISPYLVLKKKQAKLMFSFILNNESAASSRLKMQSLNNDSLTNTHGVSKQAKKNSNCPFFWAYFSGIIDTEGSFSIRKNKPAVGGKSPSYCPLIQLTMASFETMNFIRENICLGNICFPKAKSTQRGFTYKLMFSKISSCLEIIDQILPYLKFKKEVALEMINFCKNYKKVDHRQAKIPIEELEFRENCYKKIKQINECGIVKPSLIDSEALKLGNEGQV